MRKMEKVFILTFVLLFFLHVHIISGRSIAKIKPFRRILDKQQQMDYLRKYSGLQDNPTTDQVTSAIRTAQSFMGLPQTGTLDAETVGRMGDARCSVPDVNTPGKTGSPGSRTRSKRYDAFGPVPGWEDGIDWYYTHQEGWLVYLSQDDVRRIITRSAQLWMDAAPSLQIRQVNSSSQLKTEDFHVFVGDSRHYDNELNGYCPYSFSYGELAHAFFPTGYVLDGDMHLNARNYYWQDGATRNAIDMNWVMTHEMGHSLGLGHSSDPSAVMAPYYPGSPDPLTALHPDDVAGIQHLYGSEAPSTTTTTTVPPAVTPSTTQSSTPSTTTPTASTTTTSTSTTTTTAAPSGPARCPYGPCSFRWYDRYCRRRCYQWCYEEGITSVSQCRDTFRRSRQG